MHSKAELKKALALHPADAAKFLTSDSYESESVIAMWMELKPWLKENHEALHTLKSAIRHYDLYGGVNGDTYRELIFQLTDGTQV